MSSVVSGTSSSEVQHIAEDLGPFHDSYLAGTYLPFTCILLLLSGRRRRALALASVRRSNCTYSFPVCSFYEDSVTAGCKRRNQPHQVHKLIFTVQRRRRKLLPTAIAPTFKPMRPDPPHDPTVELIEERSDVGSFVILAPSPQKRVKFRNQLRCFQRDPPFGSLPNLVPETLDRLLTRVRVECTRTCLAANLAFG